MPEEDQAHLRRGLLTPEATVTSSNVTALLIPLSLTEAIEFQRSLSTLEAVSAQLIDGSTDASTAADVADTRGALTAYFVQPTVGNFESFMSKLNALRTGTQAAIPTLATDATKSQSSLTGLIEAILTGRQPSTLQLDDLLKPLPATWAQQRSALHNSN